MLSRRSLLTQLLYLSVNPQTLSAGLKCSVDLTSHFSEVLIFAPLLPQPGSIAPQAIALKKKLESKHWNTTHYTKHQVSLLKQSTPSAPILILIIFYLVNLLMVLTAYLCPGQFKNNPRFSACQPRCNTARHRLSATFYHPLPG